MGLEDLGSDFALFSLDLGRGQRLTIVIDGIPDLARSRAFAWGTGRSFALAFTFGLA
jgi:hypothetical protein